MQAVALNMMFTILYKYVGTDVSCLFDDYGKQVEYRGILKEVRPFNGIIIDDDFVPFDTKDSSIVEIVSLEDHKSLFINLDKVNNITSDEKRLSL